VIDRNLKKTYPEGNILVETEGILEEGGLMVTLVQIVATCGR
jgi:hypothetical protein